MNRQPIKPEFRGCGTCSSLVDVELTRDLIIHFTSTNIVGLEIDGESYEVPYEVHLSLEELEEIYETQLQECKVAELSFDTPFNATTYEYDKSTKKWYLVEQGEGFA